MSLYQKYRAKSFREVLTQDHVTVTLQSAIKNDVCGHAYVFVGTRGTGKTSIARIFARTLNCHNETLIKEHGEPCNECDSCLLSINGSNVDIIEMDAASNRGIDEVRNLKESVDFLPSIGKYKVYIIDEAHMMTKEAFNALLKTIEEPPKHVVFMMCTTEIFKLPATIVSRSQVFELKHASLDEIMNKIDVILSAEGISLEKEAKRLIAKLGKGSFRDTESILEKVLSAAVEGNISHQEVLKLLGLTSVLLIDQAKALMINRDLSDILQFLSKEVDEGSLLNFNHQVAESLYEDIEHEIGSSDFSYFKLELFEFLSLVDKDLRNAVNIKQIYISKILNFLSGRRLETLIPQMGNAAPVIHKKEEITVEIKKEEFIEEVPSAPVNFVNNPSALLRQRSLQKQPAAKQDISIEVSLEAPKPQKEKFISKLDFLEFMKTNNSFLYRFFSSHDFQITSTAITIDAARQMERDLIMKPQTLNLIKIFGDTYSINLEIKFGTVEKVSEPVPQSHEISKAVQKKVEDLSETELKEIFKAK